MFRQAVLLVALALFGSSLAQCPCSCSCGGVPQCLPPANPQEALSAALALPLPLPPAPAIPADLYNVGPILDGCGPPPTPLNIIQAPSVTIPGPETPVIPLPEPCLPPIQIIGHKCVVSKAVLKPQVYQRLVQVPTIARFLKKSFAPVLENIAYTAVPQCGQAPPPAPLPLAPACLPAPAPLCVPAPAPLCIPPPPPPRPCGCGCGIY